jgi:hypothetical protein
MTQIELSGTCKEAQFRSDVLPQVGLDARSNAVRLSTLAYRYAVFVLHVMYVDELCVHLGLTYSCHQNITKQDSPIKESHNAEEHQFLLDLCFPSKVFSKVFVQLG